MWRSRVKMTLSALLTVLHGVLQCYFVQLQLCVILLINAVERP